MTATITAAQLASLDFCTTGAADLWRELNDEAECFAVGGGVSDGDEGADIEAVARLDINDIDGLGRLVWRAQNDGQVAIYQDDDKVTLVGDVDGPWAARVQIVAPTIRLHWLAGDEQSDMDGGEFPADCDRAEAERVFLAEMLDQCADDAQRDAVKAGRFFWR